MKNLLSTLIAVQFLFGCGLNEDINKKMDSIDHNINRIDSFRNAMPNYDSLIQEFKDSQQRKNKYVDTLYIK